MKCVQTSITKENWMRLRRIADAQDKSLYALVREIIINFLNDKEKQNGRESQET